MVVYRFLIARRWLVRILAGLLLVAACVRLGMWQLDRADERDAANALVTANLAADPVPAEDVLSTQQIVADDDQWRSVVVRGHWDADHQLLLRLRPVDGQHGVHVITPLVTRAGAVLLVDRGFVVSSGPDVPEVAAPPRGEVDVTARVRAPESRRGTGGDPTEGTIRYMDVDALAGFVGRDTYRAWGELIAENPPSPDAPEPIAAPETEAGPHLSYALQWFAFAIVGIVGFVVLIRMEGRAGRPDEATAADGPEPAPAGPDPRT